MTVSRSARAARWGGAVLLALAPLPWLGLGAAQAETTVTYATVTGHEPFSAAANQPGYWGDDCEKIVDSGSLSSYVLADDYALVVVKAASKNVDPYTNTLFEDASAGETVWADTNGNFRYDPGGKGGDKAISHIIVCEGEGNTSSSAPASSSAPVSSSPAPSTTKPTKPTTKPPTTHSTKPTETQSTGSASPSTSISTSSSSAAPSTSISTKESGSKPEKTRTTSESAAPAQLAKTGSELPVTGAIGISLLLIGLGALLLLGPGRLIPSYHRKH